MYMSSVLITLLGFIHLIIKNYNQLKNEKKN